MNLLLNKLIESVKVINTASDVSLKMKYLK